MGIGLKPMFQVAILWVDLEWQQVESNNKLKKKKLPARASPKGATPF